MDPMLRWQPVVLFVLVGLVRLAVASIPSWGRSRTDHFARRVDLALDPEVAPAIARRVARRERVGAAGAALGAALSALVPPPAAASAGPLVLALLGFLVGHAVAVGSGRLGRVLAPTRPVRHPGGARVRSRDRGLRAPPGTPRRMAAGGRGGRGRGGTAGRAGGRFRGGGTGTARADPDGNTGAAGTRGGRRGRRAQTAGPAPVATSTLELAWDDALRARTLRDLGSVPLLVGTYLPVLALLGAWLATDEHAAYSLGWSSVMVAPLVVGLVIALVRRPERHYRRRLWASSGPLVGGAPR